MKAPVVDLTYRSETPDDGPGIRTLHCAAFPSTAEADLVDRLRADGDLTLSLVALSEKRVVGHIAFSPVTAPFRAVALAPLAVAKDFRGRGVGAFLIRTGLAQAAEAGWQGAFVLGDPSYYEPFGFSVEAAATFDCAYSGPYLMLGALGGGRLPSQGVLTYAPAFAAL